MSPITHVCLSDLHLGEEDSVLSNFSDQGTLGDPRKPGPMLLQLAKCLKELGEKLWPKPAELPVLVLNGDAIELDLCLVNDASMAFQCFLNALKEGDGGFPFKEIVYVPGNHDHHLWEMSRESQYLEYLDRKTGLEEEEKGLPPQWHSTKMFSKPGDPPVDNPLLNRLKNRPFVQLEKVPLHVAYPNFGVLPKDYDHKGVPERCVVFHHGHFTEWIYTLMSEVHRWIYRPKERYTHVWDLEKQNFAWIDFAWSALGQSFNPQEGLELVYEKSLNVEAFDEVINRIAEGASKEFDFLYFDLVEKKTLEVALKGIFRAFAGTERSSTDCPLSSKGKTMLFRYIEILLRRHVAYDLEALRRNVNEIEEFDKDPTLLDGMAMPRTSFVFGHTHKPFSMLQTFRGYPDVVEVHNTGGWVVDTLDPRSFACHGGSVLLVDDQLNVASIRMYHEDGSNNPIPVAVETVINGAGRTNPLAELIRKTVKFTQKPWTEFSVNMAKAVALRRMYLNQRVHGAL